MKRTKITPATWFTLHSKLLFLMIAGAILLLSTYLRFFELGDRMQFTWDQIENAWMMKDMLLDGKMPTHGMVAKASSGFYIGPDYYYLLAPFYAITHLDPLGGGYFVGVVSIITLLFLLYASYNMFGKRVSLIAGSIYATSSFVIGFDRIQWPVVLLPLASLGVFYALYKIHEGKSQYFILLGLSTGFAFHLHLTAIYFPFIILGSLLFHRPTKNDFLFAVLGILASLIFFLPILSSFLSEQGKMANETGSYMQLTYHGIHLRRILQLLPDGFLEIGAILYYPFLGFVRFFILPLFLFFLYRKNNKSWGIIATVILFFLVPTVILSTYTGELTNYYYTIERPLAILAIAYLLSIISRYRFFGTTVVGIVLLVYAYSNISYFIKTKDAALPRFRNEAITAIETGQHVDFSMGSAKSYLYFYYLYRKNGVWPK